MKISKSEIDKLTIVDVRINHAPDQTKIEATVCSPGRLAPPPYSRVIYSGPSDQAGDLEEYTVKAMERGGPKVLTFGDLEVGDRFRYIGLDVAIGNPGVRRVIKMAGEYDLRVLHETEQCVYRPANRDAQVTRVTE